jgi:hypothetical protein
MESNPSTTCHQLQLLSCLEIRTCFAYVALESSPAGDVPCPKSVGPIGIGEEVVCKNVVNARRSIMPAKGSCVCAYQSSA